jgi:hypothetical protein
MSAAFTPGPWMMAAIPSSVVGWPIVKQGVGRSICSISYLPRDADADVYAESEANGRLITAAPDLLAACEAQEELVNFVGDDARPAIKRVQQMRRAAILKARGDAR